MNLNTLIDTYKQINRLELQTSGGTHDIDLTNQETEKLKDELRNMNLEIIRLSEENLAIEKDLQEETSMLEHGLTEMNQSYVTPQTLTTLENQYQHIVSETRLLAEKNNERETLFQQISHRLADPHLQDQFQQLSDLANQLNKLLPLEKKQTTHKEKLLTKKNLLANQLETIEKTVAQIQQNSQQEMDSFLQYREQAPNLEKKKTSLTKKNTHLIGKLLSLQKKLQNEASEAKVQQYQQELENYKKELETHTITRTRLDTQKQELTLQLEQQNLQLEKFKTEIAELESIANSLTGFLKEKGCPSISQENSTEPAEISETLLYLKKYIQETVLPQDNRFERSVAHT